MVLSSGPGAVARQSISTAVLGGMVIATSIGILIVPLFLVLLGKLDGKLARKAGGESESDAVTAAGVGGEGDTA